jgi:YidC/Oxa1 family membrane protein insertase
LNDFPNPPQQDPGIERRLLLVFALTFLIIVAVQPLLMKKLGVKEQPAASENKSAQTATPPSSPPSPASVQQEKKELSEANASPGAKRQASAETETVVENDLYRITFSNRGAQVKSWILKKFKDEKGHPLELVNSAAASRAGYPLSLWTYDEALRAKLGSALFVPSATGAQRAPAEFSFEYADSDVVVRKRFRFDDTYVVQAESSLERNGSAAPALLAWPSAFGDEVNAADYSSADLVLYSGATNWHGGQDVQRTPGKKISGGATVKGPFSWAGAEDHYFAAVFIPDQPESAVMVTLRNELEVPKTPDAKDTTKVELVGAAAGNASGPTAERVFVGPKTLDVVETVKSRGGDLRGLVNFGFFGFIAHPLFLWLRWTYDHLVRNWGWAIILQTVIINLALLPLRISSMKSSFKMQKVAPQIKAIQEKYKKYSMKDPRRQQMNQEVAEIYKREGVNPIGGCLPLVIQMPFLFAYYSMLGASIELRQAPWVWLHDLSASDPYHILPIGIIITTLFVQRMTPQAGMDPTQQRMMNLMMPLMLGVISWNLAAGLCLYWTVGNGIAIGQQAIMNRSQLGREMRAELEKRARKKKELTKAKT